MNKQKLSKETETEQCTIPSVVRSYFKNCGGCGKITKSDRWIQKTERNIKDHYRPICSKCAIWAELPVY